MKVCAVSSCRKDSSKCPGVTFFNLPRDPCAKSEWLEALGLKTSDASQSIKVCEAHFRAKDFCAGRRQLKGHAVPALHLGVRKTEPLDSDDEFMHCDSDNDDEILAEVKKISAADAMMDRKIKQEIPEEEPEQETGRRPSRRAAREAAKKIYNTVRNFGCTADADDPDVINTISIPKSVTNTRSTPRQRQRSYQNIKVPPPNIDLVMECHEELLSTVQAEALLQAQLQYNMVMKTLRSLKASNVKIICASADEPVTADNTNGVTNSQSETVPSSPNSITIQPIKKENGIESSPSVQSPATSILS